MMKNSEELEGLNEKQKEAALTSADQDVLITAGAGSGKTFTLAKKVLLMISNGYIKPDELLVLTFTNKAAFEMKSRIISLFGKKDKDNADKILSAHIQTFDSFSAYLVKKYSVKLGLTNNIQVANETVINSKINEYLDDVLNEYYQNKDPRIINFLRKFDTRRDANIKKIILSIREKLESLLPEKRESFINEYDDRYLSKQFFDEKISCFISKAKKVIEDNLYKMVAINQHLSLINQYSEQNKYLDLAKILASSKTIDNIEIKSYSFDNEKIQKVYERLIALLSLDGQEFFDELIKIDEESPDFNGRFSKGNFDDKPETAKLFNIVKTLIRKELADYIYLARSRDLQYNQLISFKDDIHLIFEIINKIDTKLSDYKKVTASFTFSDISNLALKLVTDKKYEKEALEIKNRFKYIMVDEYQDTNDFQEKFLDSFIGFAHIFVVGDPKQSIYAFRNSNVELFNNRARKYQPCNSEHKVIAMNTNYRSVPKVLDDINYIFKKYMTVEHGGIDYLDKSQQLICGSKEAFPEERDHFGIGRIVVSSSFNVADGRDLEITAIITDIIHKIENKYEIYDHGKLRPVEYKDFAIIVRKKTGFSRYSQAFNNAGIPLNDEIEDDLRNFNPIILLQSLIGLIEKELDPNAKTNVKHLFASVARSYIYGSSKGYTDEKIYDLLTDDKKREKDPITIKIKEFCKKNINKPFSFIFMNLLTEFGVVENLPSVGEVENNVSKIESLYSIVSSQENSGEGLKEFISLFRSMKKFDLGLDTKTTIASKNAVTILTIHASKGLEYPIVYLPVTYNDLSTVNGLNTPIVFLSEDYGIQFPDYIPEENVFKKSDSALYSLAKETNKLDSENVDEHVRLFYVALTRAKDSIIIVGNENKKKKENLISMLKYTEHYMKADEQYIKKYKEIASNTALYNTYKDLTYQSGEVQKIDLNNINPGLVLLIDEYVKDILNQKIKEVLDEIEKELFTHYIGTIDSLTYKDKINILFENLYGYDLDDMTPSAQLKFDELYKKYESENNKALDDIFGDIKGCLNVVPKKEKYTKKETEAMNKAVLDKSSDWLRAFAYNEDKIVNPLFRYDYFPHFDDRRLIFVHRPGDVYFDAESSDEPEYRIPEVDNKEFNFEVEKHIRASAKPIDKELESQLLFSYGNYNHELMELVNFDATGDDRLSNIPEKQKEKIKNILNIIDKIVCSDKVKYYQERPFHDEVTDSNGFIDLLAVKEDEIIIFDYKSSDIEKPEYVDQLNLYQKYIENVYGKEKKIRKILISINKGVYKEL